MKFLQIPPLNPEDIPAVNIADSLKVVTETAVTKLIEKPEEFLSDLIRDLIQFGLKVLAALAIYAVGAWLVKCIRRRLKKIFEKKGTERTIATFTLSLTSIVLYLILIISVIGTLGINTTSVAALLAAGGMAIGMALSGTVQNFAGGIMILIFKPFKSGDLITAQGFTGFVDSVSIMSTKILTPDNRMVIIPNGALSNGNIDNSSATGLRRIEWKVGVEYGSDCEGCKESIREILLADPRILGSGTKGAQDAFVALSGLNESNISFIARAWVKIEDYWDVYFGINEAIYKTLPEKGFSFAYPHMDVNIKNYTRDKS